MEEKPTTSPACWPDEYTRLERQRRRDLFIAAALPEAMREVAAGLIVTKEGEEPQHTVARVARGAADAVLACDDIARADALVLKMRNEGNVREALDAASELLRKGFGPTIPESK